MPPRFAYWTIIFGGQPTSFRSATRDELTPTFKQIQARHPDAQLRYFARGKLWYSDEEAQAALVRERFERSASARPRPRPGFGATEPRRTNTERRGPGWRPGGTHKDPRDRFKVPRDVKRARFKAAARRDRVTPRPPVGRKPPKKKDEE